MKSLDYILPICNIGGDDFQDRVENLNLVLNRFLTNQTNINLHVYLIEQVINPEFPRFIDLINIPLNLNITIKSVSYPVFCKPWLYNIGVKISSSENIILADMDAFSDEDYFSKLVDHVNEKELKWCFGWSSAVLLLKKRKEKLIKTGIIDRDENENIIPENRFKGDYDNWYDNKYIIPKKAMFEGFIVLFKRYFFVYDMIGANELFKELHANDNELAIRAHILSNTYQSYPVTIVHLWHRKSKMKSTLFWKSNEELKVFTENNHDNITKFLKNQILGGSVPLNLDLKKDISSDFTHFPITQAKNSIFQYYFNKLLNFFK